MNAELLVAGSIALDTLEGSFGRVENELGGSALYFALAASLITPVRVVAPVGRDELRMVHEVVGSLPIDLTDLDVIDAPTYRWRARQEGGRNLDFGSQDSIYDRWHPNPPPSYSGWSFVGSMRPDRQAQVAAQLDRSKLLAADAMLSYVRAQPAEAQDVLHRARWYFCNREEFAALGGVEPQDFRRRWSLEGLVIKSGAGGVTAYTNDGATHVPALDTHRIVDTTGAGDATAAGMLTHWLISGGEPQTLRASLAWGVACASITIEDIGLRGIARATRPQLDLRVEEVMQCLAGESPSPSAT
ncbi:MAG TPA: PfkB family carbohydrate kinase [Candidatus Dormibacteraeota bacterium]|nr:PfkB family carbohydrate kinase [Candidatus Dormibacteraeota bacterium]